MAIYSIPSATTITITGGLVVEVSGTTTVQTILGVSDGQVLKVWPTGAFAFGSTGNILAPSAAQVVGTPVFLLCRNGVLTQIGVSGYGSTGTGNLVRETSPTIVTPVIASFATAQHNHTNAAGGGQITSAAVGASDKTGTGDFVLQTDPTIDNPTITTRLRLPGPVFVLSGSGTPEGAVTANVGSLYLRTDGGAGTALWIKESGSSSTGWASK